MKISPMQLAVLGLVLALAGTVLNFNSPSTLGALIAFGGFLAADRSSAKMASVPRHGLALAAGLFFSLAAGVAAFNSAGLGVFLVLAGARLRYFFLPRWGVTGFPWVEPALMIPGLGLALWDCFGGGNWLAWLFTAYLVYELFGQTMGLGMALSILRLARGGKYGVDPGKPAPDFTLSDETDFPVSLSSFKGRSHVLLIFVRGDWCPSCHITLRTYARHKDRFQEKDIVLLAIGPDPVGVNRKMVQELGVPYKMLSDEGQKTAMAYGVQLGDKLSKGVMAEGVPLPASFLVDKQGLVRYSSRPERAGEFLDPQTLFPALQGLGA